MGTTMPRLRAHHSIIPFDLMSRKRKLGRLRRPLLLITSCWVLATVIDALPLLRVNGVHRLWSRLAWKPVPNTENPCYELDGSTVCFPSVIVAGKFGWAPRNQPATRLHHPLTGVLGVSHCRSGPCQRPLHCLLAGLGHRWLPLPITRPHAYPHHAYTHAQAQHFLPSIQNTSHAHPSNAYVPPTHNTRAPTNKGMRRSGSSALWWLLSQHPAFNPGSNATIMEEFCPFWEARKAPQPEHALSWAQGLGITPASRRVLLNSCASLWRFPQALRVSRWQGDKRVEALPPSAAGGGPPHTLRREGVGGAGK